MFKYSIGGKSTTLHIEEVLPGVFSAYLTWNASHGTAKVTQSVGAFFAEGNAAQLAPSSTIARKVFTEGMNDTSSLSFDEWKGSVVAIHSV